MQYDIWTGFTYISKSFFVEFGLNRYKKTIWQNFFIWHFVTKRKYLSTSKLRRSCIFNSQYTQVEKEKSHLRIKIARIFHLPTEINLKSV